MKLFHYSKLFNESLHTVYGRSVLLLSMLIWAGVSWSQGTGGPPTMPLPTEAGSDNQALLAQFWGWGNYAMEILVILIGVAIFAFVAWFVITKFIEIGKTQGSFAMAVPTLLVGLFVLAIGGVLLTIAWNILQNTTLTA